MGMDTAFHGFSTSSRMKWPPPLHYGACLFCERKKIWRAAFATLHTRLSSGSYPWLKQQTQRSRCDDIHVFVHDDQQNTQQITDHDSERIFAHG